MKDYPIYISSSCLNRTKIADSVKELASLGFSHIELSGGTNYYEGWLEDLLELQVKHGLKYRCHNYFPPPKEHFVLNLASNDEKILFGSIEHLKAAIELSAQLGAREFGFHAGFRFDPRVEQFGQKITKVALQPLSESVVLFCELHRELKLFAASYNVRLYVENNVFSGANARSFGRNPFLLTHFEEFLEINATEPFNLLLDVAHLKVSCRSLGLNFESELLKLMPLSDYLHISDNNGIADLNGPVHSGSALLESLAKAGVCEKHITLEVYSGPEAIESTYQEVDKLRRAS